MICTEKCIASGQVYIGGSPCFNCTRNPENRSNFGMGLMTRGTHDNFVEDKRSISERMKSDFEKVPITKTIADWSKQSNEYAEKRIKEFADKVIAGLDEKYLSIEGERQGVINYITEMCEKEIGKR